MEAENVITALGALAQETRLAAFRLLVRAGPAGMTAGLLAERLAVAPSNLSFHLNHLQTAGLVQVERRGRQMNYRADYSCMDDLLGFLTANCCEDGPDADRPVACAGTCANRKSERE